ncbi:hypothetical protein DDV21_000745 [Streptococcus chenjunshii]|uniref:DUF4386 domain-containing protein n=1 Tax=Streptococcus chenjunshii TaxID=2173853 RepID=A0A372KN44_9STRE|nr:hypothetical protein [Streptococcus chenjunshii]AXQ77706.1 hypothetical protein DDV21_000745 [Streptococcus chenjunshii]RFU50852.1 hypothetical protein DDV22_06590 [Streptococcus chenjunshii]RFU52998.1 hypothetical protein DDV23_06850 [Streptococcus chenjunshii]
MKEQVFKQNRKYFSVLGMFLAGCLIYMVVRIGFLYFSFQLEMTNSLQQTVERHSSLLMAVDELLMFSTILFGSTFYNVRKLYFQNKKILTGLLVTSFILMLMVWLLIVVKTGRLIYPVNGLPVVTGDNLSAALAEIYAAWHLCDILLGLFMISWAGLLSRPLWKYSGIIIGLIQVFCTYFGQSTKPIPLLMAVILSTIWLLKQWRYFKR